MAFIVLGISENGHREILKLNIVPRETARSWKKLLLELKERDLRKVVLPPATYKRA